MISPRSDTQQYRQLMLRAASGKPVFQRTEQTWRGSTLTLSKSSSDCSSRLEGLRDRRPNDRFRLTAWRLWFTRRQLASWNYRTEDTAFLHLAIEPSRALLGLVQFRRVVLAMAAWLLGRGLREHVQLSLSNFAGRRIGPLGYRRAIREIPGSLDQLQPSRIFLPPHDRASEFEPAPFLRMAQVLPMDLAGGSYGRTTILFLSASCTGNELRTLIRSAKALSNRVMACLILDHREFSGAERDFGSWHPDSGLRDFPVPGINTARRSMLRRFVNEVGRLPGCSADLLTLNSSNLTDAVSVGESIAKELLTGR